MSDEQIDHSRRELKAVLALTHERIGRAVHLLSRKAMSSPLSAEADAYDQLVKAKQDIEGWCIEAAGSVGLEFPEASRQGAEAQRNSSAS